MQLSGVFAASVTPLTADLKINLPLLIRHAKWLLKTGCDGVVFLGTTGEANSFSVEERMVLIDAVAESDLPEDRIIIGTGCCALPDTVRLSIHALDRGFETLLLLPPFYYKNVTDQGLEMYFREIIEQIGNRQVRIILYHFPKFTGVPFSLSLLEKLVSLYLQTICGMKDSGGDFENMRTVCSALPGFAVFSGTEKYLLDILKIGGAGCISATVNVTGRYAADVYRNWRKGNPAEQLQNRLSTIRKLMDGYPLIGMLKKMIQVKENNPEWQYTRPPNLIMQEDTYGELIQKLAEHEFSF